VPGSRPEAVREVLWLVVYDWDAGRTDDVRALYPAHLEHVERLGRAGGLLLIGRTAESSATALFRDEGTARRFLADDPLFITGTARLGESRRWQTLRYDRPVHDPGAGGCPSEGCPPRPRATCSRLSGRK